MVGIGAWTVIVAIPAGILLALGVGASDTQPASAAAMIVIGLAALVVVSALAGATRQVFAVALYRYATAGAVGGFDLADLEHPFTEKKKGRGTHWVAYLALGLIVALVAIAAIFGKHNGEPLTDSRGHAHVYFTANRVTEAEIRDGMPVVYESHRIGKVLLHRLQGGEIYVRFYVVPAYRGIEPGSLSLDRANRKRPYLRLTAGAGQ